MTVRRTPLYSQLQMSQARLDRRRFIKVLVLVSWMIPAIAREHPALGDRDDVPEGRDPVLQRHQDYGAEEASRSIRARLRSTPQA
jgi:hypothetical protein